MQIAAIQLSPIAAPRGGELTHAVFRSSGFVAKRRAGEREKRAFERIGAGLLFEFRGCAPRDDCAVVHDRDAMRDAVGFVHVMRREKNGGALGLVEILYVRPKLVAALRVEAERRFVKEQNFRRVQKTARDFEATLHSAGKRLHEILATLPEFERFQQILDAFGTDFARHVIKNAVELHVLVSRLLGVKARVLKHNAEALASLFLMRPRVEAIECDAAARWPKQRGEHFDRCGFAGAIRAEKGKDLALGNVEGDALYGFNFVKRLCKVLNVDQADSSPVLRLLVWLQY